MASIERFDSLFRRDQKKMPSKLITVQITQNSLEGFFFLLVQVLPLPVEISIQDL